MKHIFILNPVAGSGKAEKKMLPFIIQVAGAEGIDYEIHRTINVGDAENFVRNRCQKHTGDRIRFYAVGGDGTLNEVANGVYGNPNVEIAFIPTGTGNDFARIFTNQQYFTDIKRQLDGQVIPIDLINYDDRVIVNMLNIGLDCAVVKEMNKLKKKLPLEGPLAYMAGVASVFAKNRGYLLKVTLEDGRVFDQEFTLVAVGNGSYCGGGFKGVPKAEINDGLLDVSLISRINRRVFASLIGKYRKGTHLESPLGKEIVTYVKCKSLTIEPEGHMDICVDGEVYNTGALNLKVIPNAIRFSIPNGCQLASIK